MNIKDLRVRAICMLAIAFVALVVVTIWASITGGKQEPFEHMFDGYSAQMLAVAEALRVTLFMDFIFILCFGIGFQLALLVWRENAPSLYLLGAVSFALVAGLDIIEDLWLLGSISTVQLGGDVWSADLRMQQFISGLKWMMAAVALVLFSFFLPRDGWRAQLTVWGTRLGLAVGCAGFVAAPAGMLLISNIALYAGMLIGFVMVIWMLVRERNSENAAA